MEHGALEQEQRPVRLKLVGLGVRVISVYTEERSKFRYGFVVFAARREISRCCSIFTVGRTSL
jgi:hypothetical protein